MNRTIKLRLFWITLLILAYFFVLSPLFRPGFLVTDDGDWMVIRLSAFYQSLREGQFPVRFLGRLNYSFGYPVSNFLYPGFLYLGSVLHAIGFSFQNSVEVIFATSIGTGAIFLFLWLRRFFDLRASAIGVASFLFMPYLLYDVFKRGSVGEVLAIGISIVALYAIESKRSWLLSPVIAFLAISHNTLALFFLPVLLGYILVKHFWELILPFAVGVGMSGFFWLPAVFERSMVLFDTVTVSDPTQYFPVTRTLLVAGLPFVFAAVMSLFVNATSQKRHNEGWYFMLILLGSIALSSEGSSLLWRSPSFGRFIQFPYRLFALWCFAGPWFIAFLASSGKDSKRVFLAFFAVCVLVLASLPYQKSESIVRSDGFYATNEGTTTVANEYMPTWVGSLPTQRAPKRLEFASGNASIDEYRVTTDKIDVGIHAKEESVLQINTIYYPGWGALLDNRPITISYNNPMGLMRVLIPAGDHTLYMAFRETRRRFLADAASVVFFILYGMLFVVSPLIKGRILVFGKKRRQRI